MIKKYTFVVLVLGLAVLFGGDAIAQQSPINNTRGVQNQSGNLQNTGQISSNSSPGLQNTESSLLNNQSSSIKVSGSGINSQETDSHQSTTKPVSKWLFTLMIVFVFGIFVAFSYLVSRDKKRQENSKVENSNTKEPTETVEPPALDTKLTDTNKPKTIKKKKKKSHR